MATQKGRNWSSGDIVTAANLSSIERGVSAMAEEYTPTTWANGNTVTAAGLNNIEQGIASGGGSSDFSIATLTVVDNITIDLYCNYINGNILDIAPTLSGGDSVKIPIYKDGVTVPIESVDNFSTEGAITSVPNVPSYYLISGDCTISSATAPR